MRQLGFKREPTLPSPEAVEALRSTFEAAVKQPEREKKTNLLISEIESHRKHNGFAHIVAAAYAQPEKDT